MTLALEMSLDAVERRLDTVIGESREITGGDEVLAFAGTDMPGPLIITLLEVLAEDAEEPRDVRGAVLVAFWLGYEMHGRLPT